MREELDILKIVASNPSISQRKIAEQTGISLGQVNFLIKKFVIKGLIKMEGQSPKSMRYNLTPQGFAEKADKTMRYMKISYAAVIVLTDKIKDIAREWRSQGYRLSVYGTQDEMMEIIKLALIDFEVRYLISIQELEKALSLESKNAILCWEADKITELKDYNVVNILE